MSVIKMNQNFNTNNLICPVGKKTNSNNAFFSVSNASADHTQVATAAKLFTHLPITKLNNPMRIIDYVQFLVCMEFCMADLADSKDFSAKNCQSIYDRILGSGWLDIYRGDFLATVMHQFIYAQAKHQWSGSASKLFLSLNSMVTKDAQNSNGWPQSASSMARRLIKLRGALRSERIDLKVGPGKNPTIVIELETHEDDWF